MANAMDFWIAWMRGWAAATTSLLEAQYEALQRMTQLPRQASEPAMREMERAARGVAPAAPSASSEGAEEQPRRRGRRPSGGDEQGAVQQNLQAAGDKPARRGRGRPRKSRG